MISKEEVRHIANLARIELSEEETEKLQRDLSSIVDYFNILKRVDISNVDSSFTPSRKKNASREDLFKEMSLKDIEKLINLFPKKEGRHLKTKKIL